MQIDVWGVYEKVENLQKQLALLFSGKILQITLFYKESHLQVKTPMYWQHHPWTASPLMQLIVRQKIKLQFVFIHVRV